MTSTNSATTTSNASSSNGNTNSSSSSSTTTSSNGSSNVTSIEEIVKYQQELLNHQRNQKLIQKETIKLLNALNKSLTLMSDRLDEFAMKTNIKLDDGSGGGTGANFNTFSTTSSSSINSSLNNFSSLLNTTNNNHNNNNNNYTINNSNLTNSITLIPTGTISGSVSNTNNLQNTNITNANTNTSNNNMNNHNHHLTNDVIYLTAEHINNSINSICNTVNTTLTTLNTNNSILKTLNHNNNNNNLTPTNSNQADIKELFILNDFNANLLDTTNLNHLNQQPTILLNGTKLNTTFKINSSANHINTGPANFILTPTLNTINLTNQPTLTLQPISSMTTQHQQPISIQTTSTNITTAPMSTNKSSKLLDTTNTPNGNKTITSDDSIAGELESYEETSDEEKELIQSKKKFKTNGSSRELLSKVKTKESEESNNQQRLFNKFVRESVEKKLGKEFLLLHEIQQINHEIMEQIKKEALEAYPPINIRPRRAWHLAKASLRCRRRSLRRQKEKQILTPSTVVVTSSSITTTPGSVSSTSSSTSSVSTTPKLETQSLIDSNLIQPTLTSLSTMATI